MKKMGMAGDFSLCRTPNGRADLRAFLHLGNEFNPAWPTKGKAGSELQFWGVDSRFHNIRLRNRL